MNSTVKKNFIFLSQLIKIAAVDYTTGKKIGRTVDVIAGLGEMYPRVNALVIRRRMRRGKLYIPWRNVKEISEEKSITIESSGARQMKEVKLAETDILLKETFWDKQIVDISGAKVIRVNDLHLLREELTLWVAHMDVGITGLIRRLGWNRGITFILKWIFSFELKDRFISWKFVQPISKALGAESLALRVHHSQLSELLPADLADIIIDVGADERISILTSLDASTAAYTFQRLPLRIQTQIAEQIDHKLLVDLVNEMAADKVADLFAQLPSAKVNSFYRHMPSNRAAEIIHLLGHSHRIAGSIMNTDFVRANQTTPAGTVLDRIKRQTNKKLFMHYIYAHDDDNVLVGLVTLWQLITAAPEKPISELMRKRVARVRVHTNIKEVAEVFYKYDFIAVPVVDDRDTLQGIITMKAAFGSVFRKIREETEEAS